ncbi:Uncharacterised protein [Weeksella virosa]|nr:Uncharacterised protein [Weeksella virosa]
MRQTQLQPLSQPKFSLLSNRFMGCRLDFRCVFYLALLYRRIQNREYHCQICQRKFYNLRSYLSRNYCRNFMESFNLEIRDPVFFITYLDWWIYWLCPHPRIHDNWFFGRRCGLCQSNTDIFIHFLSTFHRNGDCKYSHHLDYEYLSKSKTCSSRMVVQETPIGFFCPFLPWAWNE